MHIRKAFWAVLALFALTHVSITPPQPDPITPRESISGPRRPKGSETQEGGKVSPDGKCAIVADLPVSQKMKNVGGTDGAGLCVFTSITWAMRWQNEPAGQHFRKDMQGERGGGYPEKVDQMMKKYCPEVKYIQDTSGDPEILAAILASGRMAGVTYNGHDCHYSGGIAHMVDLVAYDPASGWACISDNNFIEDNQFVWMSCEEFQKRWKGMGGGWVVCLLNPPPPPVPHN